LAGNGGQRRQRRISPVDETTSCRTGLDMRTTERNDFRSEARQYGKSRDVDGSSNFEVYAAPQNVCSIDQLGARPVMRAGPEMFLGEAFRVGYICKGYDRFVSNNQLLKSRVFIVISVKQRQIFCFTIFMYIPQLYSKHIGFDLIHANPRCTLTTLKSKATSTDVA